MNSKIAGLRILVVEDESMVSLMIESMIDDAGARVIGPAATVEQALALLDETEIDAALLDMNLGADSNATTVANRMTREGIPFAFVTGYGRSKILEGFEHVPVLPKPFEASSLEDLLVALATTPGPRHR